MTSKEEIFLIWLQPNPPLVIPRDENAIRLKEHFHQTKHILCWELFDIFNRIVFHCLTDSFISIEWSHLLKKCSGTMKWKNMGLTYTRNRVRISLSTRLVDNAHKLLKACAAT